MKGIGKTRQKASFVVEFVDHCLVSQSVKEVLQGLVDDGLVQYDKIGASNCIIFLFFSSRLSLLIIQVFWSFPSERGAIVGAYIRFV